MNIRTKYGTKMSFFVCHLNTLHGERWDFGRKDEEIMRFKFEPQLVILMGKISFHVVGREPTTWQNPISQLDSAFSY